MKSLHSILPIFLLPLMFLFGGALSVFAQGEATPTERIHIKEGFTVERLLSVDAEKYGSWVAMTIDDKNRFIVSDQYGPLYRVTVPPVGQPIKEGDIAIEKIDIDIGGAQGLLCAFDALYVVINTKDYGGRGLYRLTDTDGDDRYDKKELLLKLEEQGGEHGPHAIIPHPDGESLCLVVGNQTALPKYKRTHVPPYWGEDSVLPRVYGKGFMRTAEAPRGWIAKCDKDGKNVEIIATGFRNQYDAAFDHRGELFTYDADMEWDINTPWYRPTRVNHVLAGAEFGWRNGSAKWPGYYPDSLPATVDIGPGSPTGVAFGHGAKFPQKYHDAFFICDWSFGKLYAVHLSPEGASYSATFEEFMYAQPLPLTDLLVSPADGALYVAVGGRKVQSGLYRVTYTGDDPVFEGNREPEEPNELVGLRKYLAHFLGSDGHPEHAIGPALRHLNHADRTIRYTARSALEHQPVDAWREKVLALDDPAAALEGMVALARCGEAADRNPVLIKLLAIQPKLDRTQKLAWTRAVGLACVRLGDPGPKLRERFAKQLHRLFPSPPKQRLATEFNIEVSALLARLQDPGLAAKAIARLEAAPTQEEQIALAKNIRHLKAGWNRDLRSRYLTWLNRARTYRGGASFGQFVNEIRTNAIANFPPADRQALKALVNAKPDDSKTPKFTATPRAFVKMWTLDDLADGLEDGLKHGRDFENGRNLFGVTGCYACHRFGAHGGAIGPDLTSVAGKYSARDLLDHTINPSKEISDQYGSMIFTMKDGGVINGRIANLKGNDYRIITDLYNPGSMTSVDSRKVTSIDPNPVSQMPPGLLATSSESDIHDLLAYLLSSGDDTHDMFNATKAPKAPIKK